PVIARAPTATATRSLHGALPISSSSVGVYAENGNIYSGGSVIGSVGSLASPDDIQIAVRVATRRIWIRQAGGAWVGGGDPAADTDRKSTRLNSSHVKTSYAVFCL